MAAEEAKHTVHRGVAAHHLLVVDSIASTVVADLTRQAIALREQAAQAKTRSERDKLRYEAEGYYLEAEREIRKTHGNTPLADEIDWEVWCAISAVRMPN